MTVAEKVMQIDQDERYAWIVEHPEEKAQLRKEYLALDDQGRADLLYRLRIGGASLRLAPHQYPNAKPHRRPCVCGGEPEMITGYRLKGFYSPDLCYVRCKTCGLRTDYKNICSFAWHDWEDGKIVPEEEIKLW